METLADIWANLAAWWANVPPLPDLGLPAPGDPSILIVIATSLLAMGLVAVLSAWVETRLSWAGLFATVLALALFVWVWEPDRAAFTFLTIPEAFVDLVARLIR
ncbi:MAG: hypothetical protein AAFY65_10055 [Pseudomonadota bacterium]